VDDFVIEATLHHDRRRSPHFSLRIHHGAHLMP
jgi:hypothetical protein